MKKRLTALALAAATASTGLVALSAAPASASDCTNYPAGQPFRLRTSPSYVKVLKGSSVVLSARLIRGTPSTYLECGPGYRIGFYTRSKGKSVFNLSRTASTTTRGLVSATYTPTTDFRWFANYNVNSVTIGARSSINLVQVKG